ncbi:hypothetical protein ACJMK2_011296 [Sinanodonta woodiana]|uniref:C2H2-type domain-containing protein n=1 Tax=Sinanodonta woodiana TaxID=1069815 RepID=A0ABD3V550_SINWO
MEDPGGSADIQMVETDEGVRVTIISAEEVTSGFIGDETGLVVLHAREGLVHASGQTENLMVDQGVGEPLQQSMHLSHDTLQKADPETVTESGEEVINDLIKMERQEIIEALKVQIKELCLQLSNAGEESFLVSVRVTDGTSSHVGSMKGDHFMLLRQEIMQEFSDFCLGKERDFDIKPQIADSSQITPLMEDKGTFVDGVRNLEEEDEDEEEMGPEEEDSESPVEENMEVETTDLSTFGDEGASGDGRFKDEKSLGDDHQYTGRPRRRLAGRRLTTRSPSLSPSRVPTGGTNDIYFVCEICRKVFNTLKDLKNHKLERHDEGDHNCVKCSRIFTMKRTLDRHMEDAHFEGENVELDKHICDTCVLEFANHDELENHIEEFHNMELPMKCDICECTFNELEELMEHRKVHFDYEGFCTKCWQGFFDLGELETHIQSNCKTKEAMFKCHICGRRYAKLHAMNKHVDTHPIHSPFVCRMCGRGFDDEKDLKMHRSAAHIVRPYKCEFCGKTFKKRDSVIDHRRTHVRNIWFTSQMMQLEGQSNKFECRLCGVRLPTEEMLSEHTKRHEEGEEFACDSCDKKFFKRNLLILHARREHKLFLSASKDTDTGELLVCDWEGCGKLFKDRNKWKYHVKYHRDRAEKISKGLPTTPKAESVVCPICNKTLKYKNYLKLHMQTHTGDKPYQCEICGNSYFTPRRLKDHLRVHKGEKPFKCRICEKHFTSSSLRNQHMVVHWGSKTYICDVCGKGFMSRKHFHDHMRIHNGLDPHKCETCGKDFIYYRSLVRHALVHIDPKERPKPYKCQFCGKEYTEVTGYKHHLRAVHTGETPFQCDICGEAFHRNDKLRRHLKSRHGKKDDKMNQTHIVTTRRITRHGAPIIIKTEAEPLDDDEVQALIPADAVASSAENELHVDVIQQDGTQRVLLIGLPSGDGETTYVQETQVIEGPDGVRYIIAGSGEELQVIESQDIQQIEEGTAIIQETGDQGTMTSDSHVTFTADQETLATLANIATGVDIMQQ